jgi:hypothetical protein
MEGLLGGSIRSRAHIRSDILVTARSAFASLSKIITSSGAVPVLVLSRASSNWPLLPLFLKLFHDHVF